MIRVFLSGEGGGVLAMGYNPMNMENFVELIFILTKKMKKKKILKNRKKSIRNVLSSVGIIF